MNEVILAVSHMADQIVDRCANRNEFSCAISYSREEKPLGTGGATKRALQHSTTDHVMVLNGDSYVDV